MKLAPLPHLSTIPVSSLWYRAVRPVHVSTALATAHTAWVPGRFNAGRPGRPGFPVLYLAEDPVTPLFEVGALVGSPLPGGVSLPVPGVVWHVVHVTVTVSAVVDLADTTTLAALDTSIQELTGDWRGYGFRPAAPPGPPYWTDVPTHRLGHVLAAAAGIEGFVTYSARFPTRRNLVLFRNSLLPTSSVVGTDPGTGASISMP
jgi:RES domain-containing protein